MNLKRGWFNNKGQVTIFVIIAVLVVAIVLLIYFIFPGIISNVNQGTSTPGGYIDTCMRDKIGETIGTLSMNGGTYSPAESESYFYKGNYVRYLCYTEDTWQECITQIPFLEEHIESEIYNEIEGSANDCFNSLVESYENQGYDVEISEEKMIVDILPERIVVDFSREISLSKGESSDFYDSFVIVTDNNLYELIGVAKSIVRWERETGSSIPEAYMASDPYIKVEKKMKDNDVKIYVLSDRKNGEVFQFAIRSLAYPVGLI
jgi:hypothetical protein